MQLEARGERPTEIVAAGMTDNQTWHDCPKCKRSWRAAVAIPGVIHTTKKCETCK